MIAFAHPGDDNGAAVQREAEKTYRSYVAEGEDLAGMAGKPPWLKLFLAGAVPFPDWCHRDR